MDRFVTDSEMPAFFRRADLVVLPYRRIDQSGVLYTALAFGKAMVLSDVGGFSEIGRDHGAAELVPPGDRDALARGDRAAGGRPRGAGGAGGPGTGGRGGALLVGRDRPADPRPLRGAPVRAILLGKHKRSAVGALEHLVASGVEVVAVVAPTDPGDAADPQRLDLAAGRHGLRLARDEELYEEIDDGRLGDVDLVLSFLFWRLHPAAADRAPHAWPA